MPPISFDLHKLGWKAFQDLVGHIFDEVMGQTFQQFADGPDGGRDGAFYGQWTSDKGEALSGSFTIQCKHTSKSNRTLPDSVIDKELPKIERLSQEGLVDNYIFITNHTLPSGKAQNAQNCFIDAGAKYAVVYGAEWINKKIVAHPVLRRFVPRLYGLGDLTQIVTHQAHRQTLAVLRNNVSDLKCFVSTDAYRRSANALYKHGIVILLGEPGSGKSMIANLLALSAFDEKKLQTIKIDRPEDLNRFYNPDDPGQFLWVDDAFGATQYDPNRALEWNHSLPLLKTAIDGGALVVFTSRDYIFNAAKDYLKTSHFEELFEGNQIIINVEELTDNEREMILYNHLKCGTQPRIFRTTVKPWLKDVASTRRLLPEVARRFANPKFTKGLPLTRKHVTEFFRSPVKYLEDTLLNFAPAEKAALALVFIADGRLPAPIPEDEKTLHTITSLQSSIGDVKASLNALNNAFIYRIREDGREYWCFRHPSIRDAFAAYVAPNPELIDIYLTGTPAEKLMNEVTCGDLSLEGVEIIVPPDKYSMVLEKLKETGRNPKRFSDPLSTFLAHRCRGDFLEIYFTECESMASLPNQIRVLDGIDKSIRILSRLHLDGRLPEDIRSATIKKIYSFAEDEYSYEFAKKPFYGLMTEEEIYTLKTQIRNVIFSKGPGLIREISQDWRHNDEPRDHFSEYEDTLSSIMNEAEDEEELFTASELLDELDRVITDMETERDLSKQSSRYNPTTEPADDDYFAIQGISCVFHGKAATDYTTKLPPISLESCHPLHGKVATPQGGS